jgi:hypothetical protein
VRTVRINVDPFAAIVSIDGVPVSVAPVRSATKDLEFTVDAAGKWTTHRITIERLGSQKIERTIAGDDKMSTYDFVLQPLRKDVTVTSTPPDAHVYLDGRNIGKTPLTEKDLAFTTDPQTNQWNAHKLKVLKPGYEAVEQALSWDDGQTDYPVALKPITKTLRIVPNPLSSLVNIDGKDYPPDADGSTRVTLPFAPDASGEARKYSVVVTRKTANSEWEPATLTVGFDDGKTDYEVTLKEIKITSVDLLLAAAQRSKTDDSWQIAPVTIKTIARKDVNEGGKSPLKLTSLPRGTMIGSLTTGRDGQIVFTVLEWPEKSELRSYLKMIHADGAGGVREITDGKSLDLHPSFTPDGKEIVYSSNRGGPRMSIWKLAASGEGGFQQLTNEQTHDLWPGIDPAGKIFYQGLVANRDDPRIYMAEIGKVGRTDIAAGSGPRISPDMSNLLVVQTNEKTLKRDLLLYKLDDRKIVGPPTNLTKSPDTDEMDACWSPDGRRIAFVSDRGVDEDKRHNYDIWIMDLARPDTPTQVTANGSWDDGPVFSPKGDWIYFRSNRGGEWAIWRMAVAP